MKCMQELGVTAHLPPYLDINIPCGTKSGSDNKGLQINYRNQEPIIDQLMDVVHSSETHKILGLAEYIQV